MIELDNVFSNSKYKISFKPVDFNNTEKIKGSGIFLIRYLPKDKEIPYKNLSYLMTGSSKTTFKWLLKGKRFPPCINDFNTSSTIKNSINKDLFLYWANTFEDNKCNQISTIRLTVDNVRYLFIDKLATSISLNKKDLFTVYLFKHKPTKQYAIRIINSERLFDLKNFIYQIKNRTISSGKIYNFPIYLLGLLDLKESDFDSTILDENIDESLAKKISINYVKENGSSRLVSDKIIPNKEWIHPAFLYKKEIDTLRIYSSDHDEFNNKLKSKIIPNVLNDLD